MIDTDQAASSRLGNKQNGPGVERTTGAYVSDRVVTTGEGGTPVEGVGRDSPCLTIIPRGGFARQGMVERFGIFAFGHGS
jgi:hypothetical protein